MYLTHLVRLIEDLLPIVSHSYHSTLTSVSTQLSWHHQSMKMENTTGESETDSLCMEFGLFILERIHHALEPIHCAPEAFFHVAV